MPDAALAARAQRVGRVETERAADLDARVEDAPERLRDRVQPADRLLARHVVDVHDDLRPGRHDVQLRDKELIVSQGVMRISTRSDEAVMKVRHPSARPSAKPREDSGPPSI